MLFIIAWRNIWRQKTRSLVIITAILIGLWGLLFVIGFSNGFMKSFLDNAIKYEHSHIQIHHADFKTDQELKFFIEEGKSLATTIGALPNVKAVAERTIVNGMISSSKASAGIKLMGIDTTKEKQLTQFDELIIKGTFLNSKRKNPIIVGQQLAEDLNVKLNSKVVITFQNLAGDIIPVAYRVAGIFQTSSPVLNQSTGIVMLKDLNKHAGLPNMVNEIAIMVEDPQMLETTQNAINSMSSTYLVENWREVAPELALIADQSSINILVLVLIFMLALIFGIINTMLMAVLERIRELGMLKAIGMNKFRLFFMIMIETMFLSIVACPIGLLLGYLTLNYFGSEGLDLSAYAKGLEQLGYSTKIYPAVLTEHFIILTLGILITSILASIYPAVKAVKLKPAEALRKV